MVVFGGRAMVHSVLYSVTAMPNFSAATPILAQLHALFLKWHICLPLRTPFIPHLYILNKRTQLYDWLNKWIFCILGDDFNLKKDMSEESY